MAARDKPKAPAASKKGKQEKREQGEAPQPAGKPVEPETPVAQESLEPPEPPENWGSPFKPTMDTRMVRVLQEATLLLEMGMEEEMGNRDILVMPEFVNRLLWIRRQAECGKPLTPREGEKVDAAWDRLKSSAVAYISSKFSDEWRDIFEDYDFNTTVSESIMPLPALTARDGGLAYIVSKSITDFKECCRLVATARNSYDNIVQEVYAGRHEVSGDGNLYWGERWLCEPDKWTKFHETFQKRCAELQEPPKAPAVGTMAPEARRGKGNRRGKRGKQFSEKCHTVMDAFFKHENLDIRPYGNRLNYLSLDSKYRKWVKGEGKTFDPRGDIEAELKEHGGSVLKEGIRFYVATWRQKRRQK